MPPIDLRRHPIGDEIERRPRRDAIAETVRHCTRPECILRGASGAADEPTNDAMQMMRLGAELGRASDAPYRGVGRPAAPRLVGDK